MVLNMVQAMQKSCVVSYFLPRMCTRQQWMEEVHLPGNRSLLGGSVGPTCGGAYIIFVVDAAGNFSSCVAILTCEAILHKNFDGHVEQNCFA